MAISNLWEMAKADRYTADGREAIAKAREADVEDRTYQIGEISQKTGLQKTAEGWVKPKSGNSAGGAKKEENMETSKKKNTLENAKKMAESYRKTSNKPIYITEKDGDYVVAKGRDELEYAKENGYRLVSGSSENKKKATSTMKAENLEWEKSLVRGTDESYTAYDNGNTLNVQRRDSLTKEEWYYKVGEENGDWFAYGFVNTKSEALKAAKKASDSHKHSGRRPIIIPARAAGSMTHKKWDNNKFYHSSPKDSAPRQLTGDSKITIKG